MIARKDPADYAELLTRRKVAFACRTQLAESDARKLWASTLADVRRRISSGEIAEPDPDSKKIEAPQRMKESLTEEQRLQQLDKKIDGMLGSRIRLIGPFKKRFEERKANGEQLKHRRD